MGFNVHLHVCFACDTNEGVATLAKKHRVLIGDSCQEAGWFLDDLAQRTGRNPGPKGGLSMWGIIGNYTHEDEFVSSLAEFWKELLQGVEGGPLDVEHILIFVEYEQSEKATAIEVYLDEERANLIIKKHECPFTWMQF